MKNKRFFTFFMLLVLMAALLGTTALAQEGEGSATSSATANASVVARETTYVTAPFAGTLLPFSWQAGDSVAADDLLFTLDTLKVYAPQSGTMRAMFAKVGQDADGTLQRYGALCALEAENALYIDASTANLSNSDNENKLLHTGETLYLKAGSEKGTGVVTSVTQDHYTVEILSGSFDMDETVKCYRESDHRSDSHTGGGKVKRLDDLLVTASGRVYAIHKQAGDPVSAGDLLFEMIDSASAPNTDSRDISAPVQGVLQAVHVQPGAQVGQGQLLCEMISLGTLELSVQVDEVYLSRIALGGTLSFVFDAYPDREFQGSVTEVRPLGSSQQNATYYDVRVSLPGDANVLPGMNATVTLPLP